MTVERAVLALCAERRRYEQWLSALESKRATTPAHLYERVHGEYAAHLRSVVKQLDERRAALKRMEGALVDRLVRDDAEVSRLNEERAETELRAETGELTATTRAQLLRDRGVAIERLDAERTALKAEIARVQGLLAIASGMGEAPGSIPAAADRRRPVRVSPRRPEPTSAPAASTRPVELTRVVEPKRVVEPRPAVAAKPAAAKPLAAKPAAAKPLAAKPVETKPVASDAVTAKPVAAKPVAPKPVASKPAVAPAVVEAAKKLAPVEPPRAVAASVEAAPAPARAPAASRRHRAIADARTPKKRSVVRLVRPVARRIRRKIDAARAVRVSRSRTAIAATAAALAVLGSYRPSRALWTQPRVPTAAAAVAPPARADISNLRLAKLSPQVVGRSRAVQVRFALPGQRIESPIAQPSASALVAYQWVRAADSVQADMVRVLSDSLTAPAEAGFYKLSLVQDTVRRIVDGITLAVMVPLAAKRGSTLEGYRIGIFPFERRDTGTIERPEGLVRVTAAEAELSVSKHFRLADFLTHDGQQQWPRYAALSPRLLDKVELVISQIGTWRNTPGDPQLRLRIHSGFRTPLHNRRVSRATLSRHQYGDALDLAIDADGDGRLTENDARLVQLAVDAVERQYPELVGGMGTYSRHPFVHIDARGTRVRWRDHTTLRGSSGEREQ